jgi:hypothetical protein
VTAGPGRCPFSQSLSYVTGEYSIHLGYAELTVIMDEVADLQDRVEAEGTTAVIGDGFEDLVAHIARLRDWTGWPGVPETVLPAGPAPAAAGAGRA